MRKSSKKNKYEIIDNKIIVYTETESFIVDIEYLDLITNHYWRIDNKGYPTTYIQGKRERIYWLIMGEENKEKIDHINRNKLDNTRANLRIFDYEWQNMGNQAPRKNNKTGYQGVYKQQNKYIARIGFQRKRINIGFFDTAEEAARARDEKAKELLGEFAYLNFANEEIKEDK